MYEYKHVLRYALVSGVGAVIGQVFSHAIHTDPRFESLRETELPRFFWLFLILFSCIAAVSMQLWAKERRTGRRLRRQLVAVVGVFVVSSLAFIFMRKNFIAEIPLGRGPDEWNHYVVVSWKRSAECKEFCAGVSDVECIRRITVDTAEIEWCWDKRRINVVWGFVILAYLLSTGSAGAIWGLLLALVWPYSKKYKVRIFISYRRSDSATVSRFIYDSLGNHFGRDNVFFDIDKLIGGDRFASRISEYIRSSDILLEVIGPGWLSACDDAGRPRLFREDDLLRIEVETALKEGVRVVPLYVDGAPFLDADSELPESLSDLPDLDALTLRSGEGFHEDIGRLVKEIGLYVERDFQKSV